MDYEDDTSADQPAPPTQPATEEAPGLPTAGGEGETDVQDTRAVKIQRTITQVIMLTPPSDKLEDVAINNGHRTKSLK